MKWGDEVKGQSGIKEQHAERIQNSSNNGKYLQSKEETVKVLDSGADSGGNEDKGGQQIHWRHIWRDLTQKEAASQTKWDHNLHRKKNDSIIVGKQLREYTFGYRLKGTASQRG